MMRTPDKPWSNPRWPTSNAQMTINGPVPKGSLVKKPHVPKQPTAAPRVLK